MVVVDFIEEHTPVSTFYKAVDMETGEVLFERVEDNPQAVAALGLSECRGNFSVECKQMPNGGLCWSVKNGNGVYCTAWEKTPRRRRGGLRSYVKLNIDNMLALSDTKIAALVKLSPYIMTDGRLMEKNRSKALTADKVRKLFGHSSQENWRLWSEFKAAGILTKKDGVVKLNRSYLSRG